jgi:hypothetical protein
MADVLTIVTDACGIIGMPAPSSLLNTTDPQANSLKAMFKSAMETLAIRNWPVLEREESITVVDGTANYSLPDDFQRIIADTAYDSSDYFRLKGNISNAEFQQLLTQGNAIGGKRFRIAYSGGLMFRFAPTPDTGTTVTYVYITNQYLTDSNGIAKTTITADTDIPLLDPYLIQLDLIWRYKKSRGLDYGEEYREATIQADVRFAQATNSGTITPFARPTDTPLTDGYVRESGFGV